MTTPSFSSCPLMAPDAEACDQCMDDDATRVAISTQDFEALMQALKLPFRPNAALGRALENAAVIQREP